MKHLPSSLRSEINRASHQLAQMEALRIKAELEAAVRNAQAAGATPDALFDLIRARATRTRA